MHSNNNSTLLEDAHRMIPASGGLFELLFSTVFLNWTQMMLTEFIAAFNVK